MASVNLKPLAPTKVGVLFKGKSRVYLASLSEMTTSKPKYLTKVTGVKQRVLLSEYKVPWDMMVIYTIRSSASSAGDN